MAQNGGSPGSPLSILSSEDFADDIRTEDDLDTLQDGEHILRQQALRPSKRQKIGHGWDARRDSPDYTNEVDIDISSDTEGSVPGSPTNTLQGAQEEETFGHEQISECLWEGCPAGDLGNMDKLVDHIHDDHIGQRQKKYACEWISCTRKGISHASGYALRAHMRSHTREKPFYCSLPECDRAFTRSDALAKHMRTVHETEALRPSDPVPKNHSSVPANRLQRVRLVFNNSSSKLSKASPQSPSSAMDSDTIPSLQTEDGPPIQAKIDYDYSAREQCSNADEVDIHSHSRGYQYPADLLLTPSEASLPPDKLFCLLRQQKAWSEGEKTDLKREISALEQKRHEEWVAKELVLENIMEAEIAVELRRASLKRKTTKDENLKRMIRDKMVMESSESRKLEVRGRNPWWRTMAGEFGGGGIDSHGEDVFISDALASQMSNDKTYGGVDEI